MTIVKDDPRQFTQDLTLPPEIAPLFQSRVTDLEERVIEPDGVWRRDRKMRSRADWGHLWLDVQATDGSISARMTAAEIFPHQETKARSLFKSLGFAKQGGELPWSIEELHGELVRAFEQGDDDEIIKTAGHLAYFAWAASEPFSVTVDHDGQRTGNLYLGELVMGDQYFQHQSVHYRVAGELVRRHRNRYLEQVHLRPIELEPISNPLESGFHHMTGSLTRLDDLLTADREITEQLGAKDGPSLIARQDEFYELLDARCGNIVVGRLRSAAMFAANLIAGAWQRAGRPIPATVDMNSRQPTPAHPTRAEAPKNEPTTTDEPDGTITYVGSKNSKVFHRSDCPHAKRISSKNLVRYESAEDAIRQGKRPCRTCKPK